MAIVVIPTEVLGFVKTADAKNVWLCWTLFVVYSSGLLAHRQTPKTDRKYVFHWLGVKIVSGDNTNYIHKMAPNHSWNQHKENMGQNSIWDWRKEIGVIFVCTDHSKFGGFVTVHNLYNFIMNRQKNLDVFFNYVTVFVFFEHWNQHSGHFSSP